MDELTPEIAAERDRCARHVSALLGEDDMMDEVLQGVIDAIRDGDPAE